MVSVLAVGPLFLDVIQYGLEHAPRPGEEQWVGGGDIMAGGVANQAVACARLGLEVSLVTRVGADRAGRFVAGLLAEENISLEGTRREGAQSVTVSQVFDGDRAFTSYGAANIPQPPSDAPAPDFFLASVGELPDPALLHRWRDAGCTVIADAAWDPTGRWDAADLAPLASADIFVPNDAEALAYTRRASVHDAARALLELVPNVVVTRGARGVLVASRAVADLVELPAIAVEAIDTTGAGDSFTAGVVRGLAAGAPLAEAAILGQVAAAWTVQRLGGSASAPRVHDLLDWAGRSLTWAQPRPKEGAGAAGLPDPAGVITKWLKAPPARSR